jgi:hypothetical protein
LQRRNDGSLTLWAYKNFNQAVLAISEIEEREETVNAVLVSAKTPQHIREAFRNYFDDTSDFIALYDDAAQQIRRTK